MRKKLAQQVVSMLLYNKKNKMLSKIDLTDLKGQLIWQSLTYAILWDLVKINERGGKREKVD